MRKLGCVIFRRDFTKEKKKRKKERRKKKKAMHL